MAFATFAEPLDPGESKEYLFEFTLADGLSIASSSIEQMNSSSSAVLSPTTVTISEVGHGVNGAAPDYAVSCRLSGGPSTGYITLRCRITDTNTPTPNVFERTMRVRCQQL